MKWKYYLRSDWVFKAIWSAGQVWGLQSRQSGHNRLHLHTSPPSSSFLKPSGAPSVSWCTLAPLPFTSGPYYDPGRLLLFLCLLSKLVPAGKTPIFLFLSSRSQEKLPFLGNRFFFHGGNVAKLSPRPLPISRKDIPRIRTLGQCIQNQNITPTWLPVWEIWAIAKIIRQHKSEIKSPD